MSSHPLPADGPPPPLAPNPPTQPLSERGKANEAHFSSGERGAARLSITDLRLTEEDVSVRMESCCVDVWGGEPIKCPSGCSHEH